MKDQHKRAKFNDARIKYFWPNIKNHKKPNYKYTKFVHNLYCAYIYVIRENKNFMRKHYICSFVLQSFKFFRRFDCAAAVESHPKNVCIIKRYAIRKVPPTATRIRLYEKEITNNQNVVARAMSLIGWAHFQLWLCK